MYPNNTLLNAKKKWKEGGQEESTGNYQINDLERNRDRPVSVTHR